MKMNNIAENQNQEKSIKRLFAQRCLYSEAKRSFYIRSLIVIIIAVIFPLINVKYSMLKPVLGLIALFYFIAEITILEKFELTKRKTAAKIQELFDVEVFGIEWNYIVVGSKPDSEIIGDYSNKITEDNKRCLYNWYPTEVSRLPENPARIICQRANIWWDSSLRKKFVVVLIVISTILVSILFLFNLKNSLLNSTLCLLPFLPLLRLLFNQIRINQASIELLDNLKDQLNMLLDKIKNKSNNEINEVTIRSIQDEIFRHRSICQPIPDFFYMLFRNNQEQMMSFNADDYIKDLLQLKKQD